MADKKDLTSLTSLFPTTPTTEQGEQGHSLDLTPEEGGEPDIHFEALGELAPSSDPFASLPPLDPEVERLARGNGDTEDSATPEIEDELMAPMAMLTEDEPLLAPPLETTAVGAAILSAMAGLPEPTPPSAESPPGMMDLKDYSERLAPSANADVAATPFSLLITGPLRIHEREALLQILSRESLGIREVELEPQFDAGRILIPRISEYAGVLIVQALRNSNARMQLGASEKIYSSKDSGDEDSLIYSEQPDTEILVNELATTATERVLLTPEPAIAGRATASTLDTLHVSMNIKAGYLSQEQSPVFESVLEKLKRQLRLQALHRGADAIVSFRYELHPLEGQTLYKLVVQGTAIRLEP